jgi:ribosomal protein S18 acetylase RimI-like enzyme
MIKKATHKDLKTLLALNKEVQDFHHELYPKRFKPAHEADMREEFKTFLDDENSTVLIIHSDAGEPVGYLIFEDKHQKEAGHSYSYRSLYIHHISVNKDHQGKGYGKKLVEYVLQQARKLKRDIVEMDVWSENENSKEFFGKLGFKAFHEKMSREI